MRARAGIIAALVVLLSGVGIWLTHRGPVPLPVIARASGHCVIQTSVMRRTHMMLLRAVREEIVRHDASDARFRLTRCVACHAQRTAGGRAIPVNAPGQFCASCHAYVGVHIDCFSCHAAVPSGSAGLLRGPDGGAGNVKGRAVRAAFRIARVLHGRFAATRVGDVP